MNSINTEVTFDNGKIYDNFKVSLKGRFIVIEQESSGEQIAIPVDSFFLLNTAVNRLKMFNIEQTTEIPMTRETDNRRDKTRRLTWDQIIKAHEEIIYSNEYKSPRIKYWKEMKKKLGF